MKFFSQVNFKNITLILCAASFMGIFYNMTTESGLPLTREEKETAWADDSSLIAENSLLPSKTSPQAIKLQQAYDLYQKNQAVFLDARDKWEFSDGHIKGAVNIPNYDFEAYKDKLTFPEGTILITYCGGDDCEMSLHLAETILKLNKYKKVFYFKGGWQEWTGAGYPVETNVQEDN